MKHAKKYGFTFNKIKVDEIKFHSNGTMPNFRLSIVDAFDEDNPEASEYIGWICPFRWGKFQVSENEYGDCDMGSSMTDPITFHSMMSKVREGNHGAIAKMHLDVVDAVRQAVRYRGGTTRYNLSEIDQELDKNRFYDYVLEGFFAYLSRKKLDNRINSYTMNGLEREMVQEKRVKEIEQQWSEIENAKQD